MSQKDAIGPGKVVTIKYTLTGENGSTLDESGPEGMDYLHGAENIVPGLEKQLEGRVVSDKVRAVVPAAEGYGEREGASQNVARSSFPDDVEIEVGMQFMAEGPEGDPMPVWIVGVTPSQVEIDFNHPLAGMTLIFDVEVL